MYKIITLSLLAMLLVACHAQAPALDPQDAAVISITGSSIRAHMEILAADDMQGREAGTQAYQAAADYVAEQYRLAGLQPMDDNGSYFQSIKFLETRLVTESATLLLHKGGAILSEAGAKKLFELSGADLEALFKKHAAEGTGSFELGVSASLSPASTQRHVSSANVVGVLTGSDPSLRDEFVVYTGHLDHYGIRPGKDGNDIHNGAYDNAAGVGTILEIAQAMATLPTAPRRSVIFAMVTD